MNGVGMSATSPHSDAAAGETQLAREIVANLGPLRDFVERQLRLHEGFADLDRRQVLPDEIIDEVVIDALQRGARPAGEAAFPWLRGLARRALDQALTTAREQDAIRDEGDMDAALAPDATLDDGALGRPQSLISDSIDPDDALSPEADVEAQELRSTVASVLDALPEAEREALLLVWRDGHDLATVARIEGVPEREAQRRVADAERGLRDGLREGYGAESLPDIETIMQALEQAPLTEEHLARLTARLRTASAAVKMTTD
jgi:RNA polymerase sigma factor (sigma-70 family)